jgi:hypothetical protein
MATTTTEQTAVNTGENTPAAEATNTNTDQTVGNTATDTATVNGSIDIQPLSENNTAVDEPTNIQPPSTDTVSTDQPQDFQPLTTSTPAPDKSIDYRLTPTNTATTNKPISIETKNVQPTLKETAITVHDEPLNLQPAPLKTTFAEDTTTSKQVNDTVVADNPTNVEPQVSKKSPAIGPNLQASLVTMIRKSYGGLIILGIVFIISRKLFHLLFSRSNIFLIRIVLQLVIGWRYADECPIHWRIPHYLVVAGTIGLVGIALVIAQNLLKFYALPKANNPGFIFTFGSRSITVVCIFLIIFIIGWFIAGCIWVFRVWNKVQYRDRKGLDYCHPILYRFAFGLLFLTICYILLIVYRVYKQLYRQAIDSKKGPATLVPTVET